MCALQNLVHRASCLSQTNKNLSLDPVTNMGLMQNHGWGVRTIDLQDTAQWCPKLLIVSKIVIFLKVKRGKRKTTQMQVRNFRTPTSNVHTLN